MSTFSKQEALTFGWNSMKRHFWFFAGVLVITIIIQYIPATIAYFTHHSKDLTGNILSLIGTILGVILGIGTTKIILQLHDGEPQSYKTLLYGFNVKLFLNYIAGSLLYALIVLAGLLLFVVPAMIWSIKFQFFGMNIIDKGMGPIQALKTSAQMTQGAKWDLFLLTILVVLITFLGAILAIVGLFFTIPITSFALAYVYRTLQKQSQLTA